MKQYYIQLTKKISVSALMIATGMLLPFLTGQIPTIGNMLLPMHIPVLLCGLVCGWQYGALVGLMLPLLRCFIFGAPILYPTAMAMALELCTYGLVIGIMYKMIHRKTLLSIYLALIPAMLSGRVVWAIAQLLMLDLNGVEFTFSMFLAGGFTTALPGIVLQLVLIPSVISILHKARILRFDERNNPML